MDIDNLVLRPNCLLTRYPLVFITPPRSIFYFDLFGSLVQGYIRAHGYHNEYPILPFRSKVLRVDALKNWLKENPQKHYHFVLPRQTHQELKDAFADIPVSSYTYSDDFYNPQSKTKWTKRFFYFIHQMFCSLESVQAVAYTATFPVETKEICDRFLDRCIELAENDFI